jgi:hypothetical protein
MHQDLRRRRQSRDPSVRHFLTRRYRIHQSYHQPSERLLMIFIVGPVFIESHRKVYNWPRFWGRLLGPPIQTESVASVRRPGFRVWTSIRRVQLEPEAGGEGPEKAGVRLWLPLPDGLSMYDENIVQNQLDCCLRQIWTRRKGSIRLGPSR